MNPLSADAALSTARAILLVPSAHSIVWTFGLVAVLAAIVETVLLLKKVKQRPLVVGFAIVASMVVVGAGVVFTTQGSETSKLARILSSPNVKVVSDNGVVRLSAERRIALFGQQVSGTEVAELTLAQAATLAEKIAKPAVEAPVSSVKKVAQVPAPKGKSPGRS